MTSQESNPWVEHAIASDSHASIIDCGSSNPQGLHPTGSRSRERKDIRNF